MGIYYGAKIIYGFKVENADIKKLAETLILDRETYHYTPRELIYRILEEEEELKYFSPSYEAGELYVGATVAAPRATKGGGENKEFTKEELEKAKERFESSEKIRIIENAVEHEVKPQYHLLSTAG